MAKAHSGRHLSLRPVAGGAGSELGELFREGDAPVVLLDPQTGAVIDANPAAERFYGWTVEEFKSRGHSIWDVSTTEAAALRARLGEISRGALTRVIGTHRTASGELREVEIYCGPLRARGMTCVYGLVYDLDRQRREISAEEKLRAVVEQTIVGIYMIEDGRFSYVNPRLAELFGYRPDELVGRPPFEIVAVEDRALVADQIRRRVEGEVHSVRYEFRGRRKDGSVIDVGVHGTAATVRGKPLIIGVAQDITERRKAEREIRDYVGRLERASRGAVDAIGEMVELRDPYTAGHQHRVGELAAAIGRELGQSSDTVQGLQIAGHVHDIGKINVPAEILSKPSRLTQPEYEIIRTHAGHGEEILKKVDFPWPLAAVAQQHHERLDGSGYPTGLRDGAIVPEARVVAVADVVEAMASHRPYRPGLGVLPALKEVEQHAGTRYDADVVGACLRLFREKGYTLPGYRGATRP